MEGEGDAMGAVMVDTGSAAQEWGRIQQQKKVKLINRKNQNLWSKRRNQSLNLNQISKKLRNKKRLSVSQEIQRQKELENKSSKRIEKQKQQQELARQEALENKNKLKKRKPKQTAEAAKLKADAEAKRLAAAAKTG